MHIGVLLVAEAQLDNYDVIVGLILSVPSICRTAITAHLRKCVLCKKLRGRVVGQKMSDLMVDRSDLMVDRLEPAPPFTYSAVDYFGPFYVKEGRNQKKRWGASSPVV